jgi:hypothetical protein
MRVPVRAVLTAAAVVAVIALFGCGSEDPEPPAQVDPGTQAPATVEDEGELPADEQVAVMPLEDSLGRTPADAFMEHIAAVGTGDPAAVWETYGCSPPADFDTWAVEWEDAAEVYEDVAVHEERVDGEATARVRVTYTMRTGDDAVIVTEPGEWWRIEKVDGIWKVGWLPRQ